MEFVLLVLTNSSLGVMLIEAGQCFNFVLLDMQLCEDVHHLTIMVCWLQICLVHGTSSLNMVILAGLSILAVDILRIKMSTPEGCSGSSLCEVNGSFVQDNTEASTGGSASCEESCFPSEDMKANVEYADERLDKGLMQYGCSHYHRRCCIRAPCCNEVFNCRHCHNEAKNSIDVKLMHRHDMPRREVQQVICLLCGTEQEVHQVCINCGVCMGKYFCATCKLFDDDVSKQQYHCNGCGLCRIGGRDNFFHCFTCGCCYSVLLKNSHPCVEGAMHHDCPVCFEYLFESTNDVSVLRCGHTIHVHCLKEMQQHFQYACPLCSKSVCDMSKVWEVLDMEVAAMPMPESKMVRILCNDCGATSDVQFHVVAQKCINCKSYNTRQM